MRSPTDDSLTGLDTAHRGRLPRGGRQWAGSLGQRARASRGLPQAVVKISSYSHSAGAVASRLAYIGREGELELEGPSGKLLDEAELEQTVAVWDADTEPGRGRRFAMSALVSFPADVDPAQATEAARQFFREAFAENHDYVFAAHTDTENFHVHVVVEAWPGRTANSCGSGRPTCKRCGSCSPRKRVRARHRARCLASLGAGAGGRSAAAPGGGRHGAAGRRARDVARGGVESRAGAAGAVGRLAGRPERGRRASRGGGASPRICAISGGGGRADQHTLTDDRHRLAAVKGAVSLARFGWDLAEKDPGGPRLAAAEDREEARGIIDRAERALRFAINRIDDPQAKRAAIEARQTLYTEGVKEYREAQARSQAGART